MTKPRKGNLRAYVAGTGATGALIAGALVAFLTVGALVAFDGFPLGGGDADGSVSLADAPGGLAPEAAAAALGVPAAAVAGTPAGGTVVAAVFPGGATLGPGGVTAPRGGPDGPGPGPGPAPTGGGAVSGLVGDLDETTGSLGLNTNLGGVTNGLTQGLDNTLNNTLNNVGGAIGQPNLGNNVNNTVRGLTNGVLGNEGLTGRLLGGGN